MSAPSAIRLSPSQRAASAAAALGMVVALGLLLVIGLRVAGVEPPGAPVMASFTITPDPVPPPAPVPAREHRSAPAPSGRAATRARPRPVVAPPPLIPPPVPPPASAAPVAATGDALAVGAAISNAIGTGAGASGTGRGSGGAGSGDGGGVAIAPRHLSGTIVNRDYPRAARKARLTGSVTVRLAIAADGRVADCAVTRSSGHVDLDDATCRLARERFRYAPARDRAGGAVPGVAGWRQDWWFEGR